MKKILYLVLIVFVSIHFSACNRMLYLKDQSVTQTKIGADLQEDSVMLKFYAPYKNSLDSQMNSVIAYSEVPMQKAQPESVLSNFFSDAIVATCEAKGFAFDFAMPTTNGGIRASLPKGNITMRNAFELMPFENELMLLELKGTSVQKLVSFIIQKGGQPVSKIKIHSKKDSLISISINGMPLDPQKTYRVLTSDYLANGGDGIVAFEEALSRKPLNIKVREAIVEYMQAETKAGRKLNPQTDGRIRIEE